MSPTTFIQRRKEQETHYTIEADIIVPVYSLFLSEEARDQLRALAPEVRRNIGYRIQLLQDDLAGDVKKLEAVRNHYRLRVGTYRVLFRLNGNTLEVYAVKQRQSAYE